MEDPQLQRRGRWGSWSSARVYLDQVGALAAGQRLTQEQQDGIRTACKRAFQLIPELWEGLLEGEAPPELVVEESLGKRRVTTGQVPAARKGKDKAAKRSSLFL